MDMLVDLLRMDLLGVLCGRAMVEVIIL